MNDLIEEINEFADEFSHEIKNDWVKVFLLPATIIEEKYIRPIREELNKIITFHFYNLSE